LVFDPLAVCLVIAYNNTLTKKNNKQLDVKEELEETYENSFSKISTPERVKYKDK